MKAKQLVVDEAHTNKRQQAEAEHQTALARMEDIRKQCASHHGWVTSLLAGGSLEDAREQVLNELADEKIRVSIDDAIAQEKHNHDLKLQQLAAERLREKDRAGWFDHAVEKIEDSIRMEQSPPKYLIDELMKAAAVIGAEDEAKAFLAVKELA